VRVPDLNAAWISSIVTSMIWNGAASLRLCASASDAPDAADAANER
jgi:hypothetical protein